MYVYRTTDITFICFCIIYLINSRHYFLFLDASALVLFFKAVFAFNCSLL
nr:MAG TPA: hypothetical protein [Caudoviricetes sp.]DAR39161.1 MAG TPA: hypothetical protein [Caudoviricetes sp.]